MIQKIVLKASQEELHIFLETIQMEDFLVVEKFVFAGQKYGDNFVNIKFMLYKISAKEVKVF